MRFCFFLFILFSLVLAAGAETPVLIVPDTLEVAGNGLRAAAFTVNLAGVTWENVSFSLTGQPAENPPQFDPDSRIFFWRPQPDQVGDHVFKITARSGAGEQAEKNVLIKVLAAPSLEALPKNWDDMKKEERYVIGQHYFPATNLIELAIAPLPEYALEIRARDASDKELVLTYLPGEGKADVSKIQGTAVIYLGGQYIGERVKLVRRDLYEDVFNYFGLVFKCLESVKLTGKYQLDSINVFGGGIIPAAGLDEKNLPQVNVLFDDRPYLDTLYSRRQPIEISDTPEIKIDFNTQSGLVWRRTRLLVDDGEFSANRGEFSMSVVKPFKEASTFDVDYALFDLKVTEDKKLAFGEHRLVFEAENAYGILVTREIFARVMTLPTQISEAPVIFPSPVNFNRDRQVKIQYKLTLQANINIVIAGGDGSIVYKKEISMGDEGGMKGLNTVAWDGRTSLGTTIANGIYVGLIIDRDTNRKLEKFKITVYQ